LHVNIFLIFKENELYEESVIRKFQTTASDGKNYQVNYYNLDLIISVGYRVSPHRGTQFRIWVVTQTGFFFKILEKKEKGNILLYLQFICII